MIVCVCVLFNLHDHRQAGVKRVYVCVFECVHPCVHFYGLSAWVDIVDVDVKGREKGQING